MMFSRRLLPSLLRAAAAAFNQAAVSITGGSITGTNVPYVVAQSGVPVISLSSGTMGNNGAVSALTALNRTYNMGAWAWVPAGAVAAGVPAAAGYLWFVGSSTTAGTVYNSTWNGVGAPPIGVTTAFSTTGPGAFTGDTTEIAGPTITIAANALGPNGYIEVESLWSFTNSAGAKTHRIRLAGASGTQYLSLGSTTTASFFDKRVIANTGVTNSQVGGISGNAGASVYGASTSSPTTSAVDTTASTTVNITLQKATATDNECLEWFKVSVLHGS